MGAAVALAQSASHRADDLSLLVIFDRTVAAQDPYEPLVLVALAEPFAVGLGICGREQRLVFTDLACQ